MDCRIIEIAIEIENSDCSNILDPDPDFDPDFDFEKDISRTIKAKVNGIDLKLGNRIWNNYQ